MIGLGYSGYALATWGAATHELNSQIEVISNNDPRSSRGGRHGRYESKHLKPGLRIRKSTKKNYENERKVGRRLGAFSGFFYERVRFYKYVSYELYKVEP